MSEGSYDYLCSKDADALINTEGDTLRKMADRLWELGYAPTAAADTQKIILLIEQYREEINKMIAKLSPVWTAVEWKDSGDWGDDRLISAIREYENG